MGFFDFFKIKENTPTNVSYNPPKRIDVSASQVLINEKTIEQLNNRFVAIDFETTGLSSYSDRIVEIGAVLFENGEPTKKYGTLVHSGVSVSPSATAVNHISNEMLMNAPNEQNAISEFVSFLDDAMCAKTIIVAHNAQFDIGFLKNTLQRCGYPANLYYFDTLVASRKYLQGIENYKQETLANYYNIETINKHRAVEDALVCGKILLRLLETITVKEKQNIEDQKKRLEAATLTDYDRGVSAIIQNILIQEGINTDRIGFKRMGDGAVDCSCVYGVLRFKIGKFKKYIIVDKSYADRKGFTTEPCTTAEGEDNIRFLFKNIDEIIFLKDFIIKRYKNAMKQFNEGVSYGYLKQRDIDAYMEYHTTLEPNRLQEYINCAKEIEIEQKKAIDAKLLEDEQKRIKREEKEALRQKKLEESRTPKEPRLQPVIQFDDDGTIIREYVSIAEAVKETGVNSKSIRDAANGVQKHAGGYCWKYKNKKTEEPVFN